MDLINNNVLNVQGSATFEINEKCKELRKQGKTIYNLGLGQSPFPPPKEIIKQLQFYANTKNRYSPSKGIPELREAISNFYKENHNLIISPQQVSVGTGAKELLFLLQLVTKVPLILPSPSWSSYAPQAMINNKTIYVIHTSSENKWKLIPEQLTRFCQKTDNNYKIMILNYPSNPTGQTYTGDELKELATICKENNIIVVSDEIYSLFTYNNNFTSIYNYYPEGTIICSGLSKWCSIGGWRLGTFVFPEQLSQLQQSLTNVISESTSSPCSPVQWSAVQAFNGKFDKSYITYCGEILKGLGDKCNSILQQSNIITHPPEGGWYIFIDFSNYTEKLNKMNIFTGKDMCSQLLNDTGVALLGGQEFARRSSELSARIAFIDFDGSKPLELAQKWETVTDSMIENGCAHTINAIKQIKDWANNL